MKRSDLKKIEGLTDEAIDSIMALHGADIEATKAKLDRSDEVGAIQKQLDEANKQIDGFKKLDPDAIKKAADDWEQKAKQFEADAKKAQDDANKKLYDYKFDARLAAKLKDEFKVKNPKRVIQDLDKSMLKYVEDKDDIEGNLADQIKPIQEKEDYLFDSDTPPPRVVSKGNQLPAPDGQTLSSAIESALGIKK